MPKGIDRELRRRNHIARDLAEKKYHQRVVDKPHKNDYNWLQDLDDYWLEKEMGLATKE